MQTYLPLSPATNISTSHRHIDTHTPTHVCRDMLPTFNLNRSSITRIQGQICQYNQYQVLNYVTIRIIPAHTRIVSLLVVNKFASKGVATIVLSPKEVGGREFYQETMVALSNCSLTDPRPRPRKKVEF